MQRKQEIVYKIDEYTEKLKEEGSVERREWLKKTFADYPDVSNASMHHLEDRAYLDGFRDALKWVLGK